MKDLPTVTVYLTTKNRVELLKRSVNSVLNQTYQNFELIIVNDASTDATDEYLEDLLLKYDQVKVINNEYSKGACYGRNQALKIAKGKYITGLDDDDEFTNNRLELFIENKKLLESGYSAVCASLMFQHANKIIKRQHNTGDISLDKILFKNVVGNQVFAFTSTLRNIGGFDEKMPAMQDYDTWVRLISSNGPIYKLRDVTYIVHTSHDKPRITTNKNREKAVILFNNKHSYLMSNEHLKASEMHKIICHGEVLSFKKLIFLYNSNIKAELIKYFIFSNFRIVEKLKFYFLGLRVK